MDIRFTADHEWVSIVGTTATVGITDHAQSSLGDLVFVQLPSVGSEFAKGATVASVESVKAASDIFAPLSGTILEVNSHVTEEPSVVNSDPMGGGWLFKIKISEPSQLNELLSDADYRSLAT